MRTLELLAPAKTADYGMAAIDHGADAVYIGPPRFGARAAAGNSVADIGRLCSYAHQFGAKVYATVNTLLHDDEFSQAEELLQQLDEVGCDAVLIQDMRLLAFHSPLLLHASTQADNRSTSQVQWLYDHGFRRAVLARELSVSEVAAIHRAVPQMELEVFIHGALCVSYSGCCYASEHCYGRSANRGECAQVCRMKFDLTDADGNIIRHQRHLLSLKDLNLSAHLGRLIEAGATSFKIEGRLKDLGYVKNVTAAYSQLLDRYIALHPDDFQRASRGVCHYTFRPDLDRTFNRGYTTYFADGRQPAQASFDTPKAIGQRVGEVKEIRGRSFTVAGTAVFTNGDGLCFFDTHRQLVGFRVNRAEGNRLFPQVMPVGLKPGMTLFRSSDQAMERMLSKPTAVRKIPVTMSLSDFADDDNVSGLLLTINDGQRQAIVSYRTALQEARTPQHEQIRKELSKLGNTPYECSSVIIPASFPYFIPASVLSALRRMAVDQLSATDAAGETSMSEEVPTKAVTQADAKAHVNISQKAPRPLMQCRYCLRHELGYCVKHGGRKPEWREPLYLCLADGHRFRLEFDCSRCQMNVWEK